MDVDAVIGRGSKMGLRPPRTQTDVSRHGRVWKKVEAGQLEEKDIVADYGLVHGVVRDVINLMVGIVCGVDKKTEWFLEGDSIMAFVKE